MKLLYGHDQEVIWFVRDHIASCYKRGFPEESKAIGVVDRDGKICAGVVYHNWVPETGVMEMSCAATSARWLTREIAYFLLAYPLQDVGCQMVLTNTHQDNHRVHKFLTGLGFDRHICPRLWGRDADGHVFTLTDDAWKGGKYYLKDLAHGKA